MALRLCPTDPEIRVQEMVWVRSTNADTLSNLSQNQTESVEDGIVIDDNVLRAMRALVATESSSRTYSHTQKYQTKFKFILFSDPLQGTPPPTNSLRRTKNSISSTARVSIAPAPLKCTKQDSGQYDNTETITNQYANVMIASRCDENISPNLRTKLFAENSIKTTKPDQSSSINQQNAFSPSVKSPGLRLRLDSVGAKPTASGTAITENTSTKLASPGSPIDLQFFDVDELPIDVVSSNAVSRGSLLPDLRRESLQPATTLHEAAPLQTKTEESVLSTSNEKKLVQPIIPVIVSEHNHMSPCVLSEEEEEDISATWRDVRGALDTPSPAPPLRTVHSVSPLSRSPMHTSREDLLIRSSTEHTETNVVSTLNSSSPICLSSGSVKEPVNEVTKKSDQTALLCQQTPAAQIIDHANACQTNVAVKTVRKRESPPSEWSTITQMSSTINAAPILETMVTNANDGKIDGNYIPLERVVSVTKGSNRSGRRSSYAGFKSPPTPVRIDFPVSPVRISGAATLSAMLSAPPVVPPIPPVSAIVRPASSIQNAPDSMLPVPSATAIVTPAISSQPIDPALSLVRESDQKKLRDLIEAQIASAAASTCSSKGSGTSTPKGLTSRGVANSSSYSSQTRRIKAPVPTFSARSGAAADPHASSNRRKSCAFGDLSKGKAHIAAPSILNANAVIAVGANKPTSASVDLSQSTQLSWPIAANDAMVSHITRLIGLKSIYIACFCI